MKKIEAIAHRITETTYLNEQQFLREETISPHVVGTCLQELRHLFYDTLEDFYDIMEALATAHRLLGDTDEAIYYTEKKLAACAPHTVMYTKTLLQQAEVYQHAQQYEHALYLLSKAQDNITKYGHAECEITLYKHFALAYWAVGELDYVKRYADQILHIATTSEQRAMTKAVEQLLSKFAFAHVG